MDLTTKLSIEEQNHFVQTLFKFELVNVSLNQQNHLSFVLYLLTKKDIGFMVRMETVF